MPHSPTSIPLTHIRSVLDAHLRQRDGHDVSSPMMTPDCIGSLEVVISRLGLDTSEVLVLWLLVGFELDGSIRRQVARCDDGGQPTVGLLLDVLYPDALEKGIAQLAPDGALHRYALVESISLDAVSPMGARRLRADARVVEMAAGLCRLDSAVARYAAVDETTVGEGAALIVEGDARKRLVDAQSHEGWTMLVGPRGSGRRTLAAATSAAYKRKALVVSAGSISSTITEALSQLRAINREARLFGFDVIVRDAEILAAGPGEVDRLAWLEEPLRGRVIITTTRLLPRRWRTTPRVIEVKPLGRANCARVWGRAMGEMAPGDGDRLAATYPLAPATIIAAGKNAREIAGEDQLELEHIQRGIAMVLDRRVADLATRVEVTQTWGDIVLTDEQADALWDVTSRLEQRRCVLEDWGFGAKVGRGRGMVALFSGPPGTGKTMAAGLIAKQLGAPMYQVDLSKIQSKWIGETEKNLAALFDAAEEGAAMLLFDEADALFAKRTEVSTSNDRHANGLVNFLLQRVESFSGACILTTNHDKGIDEAFRRRLSAHVRFTTPEAGERAAIWKAMLPATAPVDDPIAFDLLGREFEMTGGYIKNAVLRAAYRAAAEGTTITTASLQSAAASEQEAMGKVVVTATGPAWLAKSSLCA